MNITAMKQALEALESFREISDFTPAQAVHAITTLRTAIEAAEKQVHPEKLAKLGWQYFECPACGSEGAQAFPNPAAQRQHITDGSPCWCSAETTYTDSETGASVVVHKEPQ